MKPDKAERTVLAFALGLILVGTLALSLLGCPGLTVKPHCTRHADGTIECDVEIHRDGKHEKPVK